MYLLTISNKGKIFICKINENKDINKHKEILDKKYGGKTKEYNTADELLLALKKKERDYINGAILSILFKYLEEAIKTTIELPLSIAVVNFMKTNRRTKVLYAFQPEYHDNSLPIIKEEEDCKFIDIGDFMPLEYENIEQFMLESIIDGEIEYMNVYKRNVFKPKRILDALCKEITLNKEEVYKEFINIVTNTHTFYDYNGIPSTFQKELIKTDDFIKYLGPYIGPKVIEGVLSGEVTNFAKGDFFSLYEKGCEALNIQKQNITYSDGYNEYFANLIYESFKKLNIDKQISLNNFEPAEHNIKKNVNKLEKEFRSFLEERIILSNRLINKRLEKLRELFINTCRYKIYCKRHNINIEIFNTDEILMEIAKVEAIWYEENQIRINLSDILATSDCINDLLFNGLDFVLAYTYINEETKKGIIELIPDSPEKEYPLAREIHRHFIIHYGPTNSGKTYQAIEALKQSNTGIYLGPLRLLALEIQDNLNDSGVPCSLLTGEEEDIVPNAYHMSSTVEKLDTTKYYDVCVIDECQMIGDEERGFAWTKAILGVCANTIYLCMGPEALDLCINLIEMCGDTYELVEHQRRSELVVQEPITLRKDNIEKYDAYIVFSKKKVLAVAAELIKMGVRTSMIYGNLPYAVRKKQVERFLRGDTDVVVSTNAIGMGMNLPVRRIIYLENQKFNGKEKCDLSITDVKQISGRAGRNTETGFVTSTMQSNTFIKNNLNANTPKIKKAYLGFSDEIISIDAPLADILKVWKTIKTGKSFKRMNIDRYIMLDESIFLNVSKREKLKMITIAFDDKNPLLINQWKEYCFNYEAKEELKRPVLQGMDLSDYENYYQALELYYSFSRNFNYDIDLEWLNEEKAQVSDKINEILVQRAGDFQRKCENCGRPMRWDSPYRTCKKCYNMHNLYC